MKWMGYLFITALMLVGLGTNAQADQCRELFSGRSHDTFKRVIGRIVTDHDENQFHVKDTQFKFHFHGRLVDGTLFVEANLKNNETRYRSGLGGEKLYDEMIAHIGHKRIERIMGIWAFGDNNRQYFKLLAAGHSPEAAALATWSGRQAQKHGFSRVKDITIWPSGSRHEPDRVYLSFYRPDSGPKR